MNVLLIIIATLLLLIAGVGSALYLHSRNLLREQKNFERGLKMIPMLIHLPPLSEDTEEKGRDLRDVIDENISKAQVLYSIIASTFQKGFKGKFYGQRHFAFEVVATDGVVNFYAAVPVVLADVVKQAVISAYPSAQLEEITEHNIFSPVGRISGTMGGELTLKEHYAYSISTYQELKRDAMQSILNALSTLEKDDGAGIQIMLRPADSSWRKSAHEIASKKRKGHSEKKSGKEEAFWWFKQAFFALFEPPKSPDEHGESSKEISSLEQTIVDSIDDKTRYPGYEVMIRVVTSSATAQQAQTILNNVVAAFALFDAQGKNGFKFTAAKDIESFVTAYIMRFFPQENNQNILNSVELATLFHFPDQRNVPTSQLERQASKQVDGPRNVPEEGLMLGYNVFRGVKKPIRLSLEDRRRHMYVVGQTGVGKSIFLENLALQDMLAGRGFAFVDPHGETVDRLVAMVPKERTEDVIYFSPADMDYPVGLNLFEFHTPEQKDFLIQEAINMLYKLYDPQHQGIIGPRYEHWFRNAALTVMANPKGGTFIDIPKVFTDKQYERELKAFVTDKTVLDFWDREMASTSDYHKSEVLGWFVSKFGAFLSNEMMRNIIGQSKSAFNLREVMDQKKILFVNLSKGRTGELNSNLLGMIFIMKFQAAAMSRANVPEEQREDFCLYVDEFQNFSTDSFATILSEARKYRLNLIVANQFTTQLTDEIRDAVFGNVGSIASFRVGADADADALSKKFSPVFDREDVLRMPNYNTVTQMLIGGVPTQPFSMATMPPLGTPNAQLGQALKQLSAAKYGRPKLVVETEIFGRLATKEPPKPAFGAGQAAGGARLPYGANQAAAGAARQRPAVPGAAKPPSTGSSFLDDWLTKRRNPAAPKPGGPTPPLGAGQGPSSPNMMPSTTGPSQAFATMPASPYSQPQPTQYRSPGSSVLSPPMPSASQAAREARRDAMSERKEQAQIDAEIKHTLANSRLVPTANAVPAPVPDLGSARPPIAPGTIP
ncbi:MAG TPA: type IV secretory system conjugative DNA transfer family protein, partial [Candidatus Saccharimonadales bacterium]|nr:type IV secretory system conjugative DNA transfer family protein [Candidatus Saccharimonadales bacterium]